MAVKYTLEKRSNGNVIMTNNANTSKIPLPSSLIPSPNYSTGAIAFITPNGTSGSLPFQVIPFADLEGLIVGGVPVAVPSTIDDTILYLSDNFFFKASDGGGAQFTTEEVSQLRGILSVNNTPE